MEEERTGVFQIQTLKEKIPVSLTQFIEDLIWLKLTSLEFLILVSFPFYLLASRIKEENGTEHA